MRVRTGPFSLVTTSRSGESGGVGAVPVSAVVRAAFSVFSSQEMETPVITLIAPIIALRIKNARRSTPCGMPLEINSTVLSSGSPTFDRCDPPELLLSSTFSFFVSDIVASSLFIQTQTRIELLSTGFDDFALFWFLVPFRINARFALHASLHPDLAEI